MITTRNIQYTSSDDLQPLQALAAGRPPRTMLLQVFSGIQDQGRIRDLIREMRTLFPGVPLIGTSTAGEILDGTVREHSVLISLTVFETSCVRSALVTHNDDLHATGLDLSRDLMQDTIRAIIVFGCGLKNGHTINGEGLLYSLQEAFPGVLLAGAQAGDNGEGATTFVFTDQGITETGAAAVSLAGEHLRAGNAYNLSWVPIGKQLTITRAEGPRVYTIDHRSPYDIYCHYLGQEVADNLPLSAADFPLIIERDGITMAIHATGVNEDGSFTYIHDFHAGERLRFGFCHAGLLAIGAELARSEISSHNPEALFIYSCVSRKWILGADVSVELASIADLAPSAGFFAYGEYYYRDTGRPCFFSQTMTILALAESERRPRAVPATEGYAQVNSETRQFRTLRVLHRLVETSAREIESMNEELARMARRDSLTGLANRRRFDEELHREILRCSRSGRPLSLLLIDVDFFKQFNDRYGHVAGDECLIGIGQVIRSAMQRPTDTACRYGGEEFACILVDTDNAGAKTVAGEIRASVENLKIPHADSTASSHVTISVGVLTVTGQGLLAQTDMVARCDQLLYRAKQQGRNAVVSQSLNTEGIG